MRVLVAGREGHAKALLAGYRGILQCDGYAAYKTLAAAGDGVTLAFCWSHVRREFIELARGKTAPVATETLQRIAAHYAIEAEFRGKPPDIRRAARSSRRCSPGSRRSSHACRAAAPRRGRSATR